MRCAVCGKEFGTGNNCQHCGSDKFTGLGNYSGYTVPAKRSPKSIQLSNTKEKAKEKDVVEEIMVSSNTMACYSCGEIIPSDSKFCPMCGRELFVICPTCGVVSSSQYLFCNQCGTNMKEYLEKRDKKEQKKRKRNKEKEEMLRRIREEDKKQEERRKAKEAKKEERKRQEELASKTIEEKHRAIIERLAREIDAKQRLKASTSEGRAEIDSERRYIDECRKKWRNL